MEEDLEPSDIFVYISYIYKYLFICKREIDIYIYIYRHVFSDIYIYATCIQERCIIYITIHIYIYLCT